MRLAGVARARALLLARSVVRPRRGGGVRIGATLVGLVLGAAIAAIVWSGIDVLFTQLHAEGASAREAGTALALLFAGALLGLLVFDLGDAVATLFVDSDLELLRRAPLPRAQLFVLKLADALPRSALLLALLAIPATLAFAHRWALPAWGWALLPLQLAALWVLPVGVGAALAIELVCRVPARRARETLTLLSTLVLTVLWIVNGFVLPRGAEPGGPFAGSLREMVAQVGGARAVPPAAWTADAVVAAAEHDVAGAAWATAWVVAAAASAVALAAWVASLRLEWALARVHTSPHARGARRPGARRVRARGLLGAVVLRDARSFARDWTVLGDVLAAGVLWTLLPLLSAPLATWDAPWIARAMLVALAVGLGYEVGARAIPFERDALAWVRLAPVDPGAWVRAKLAGASVVALPLVGIALAGVAIAFRLPARAVGDAGLLALAALLVSLSLGLWTGARFGDPQWINPRAMLGLEGRVLAALLMVLQVAVWLGIDSAVAGLAQGSWSGVRGLASVGVALPVAAGLLELAGRTVRARGS